MWRLENSVEGVKGVLLGFYTRALSAWSSFRSRFENENGVIATEYIILLVLIALVLVGGATFLGIAINNKLSSTGSKVSSVVP